MKKFYSDIQALCGLTVSGTTTLSTATGVTRTTSDNSTHLATTAFVKNQGYITAAALAAYVPTSRTLTINGVSYDLTANRSWTISSADGYISDVQLNGNSLDFTGQGSAFSGSIDLSTIVPVVETVYATVKNVSGALIYKGTPLAVVAGQTSGFISDVIPADASDPAKMPAVFIANENIADDAEGEAVVFGEFTGVDTSLYQSGTIVYVAPGGGWTATKPIHPNLIQNLGVITKQHATNGGGIVTGVGRANALPNLTAGKIWVGTTNYPIESTTVHIDETNNRVGIGTSTPADTFTIQEDSADFSIRKTNGDLSTRLIQYGSGAAELRMYDATVTQTVQIAADTSRVSYINNGQNFGIGTTSPSQPLHVYKTSGHHYGLFENTIYETGVRLKNSQADWTIFVDDSSNNNNPANGIGFWDNTANANRLVINGSGSVGIGTTSPEGKLHIQNGSAGSVTPNTSYDELIIENSGNTGISFLTPDGNTAGLTWATPSDALSALLNYNNSNGLMSIGTYAAGGEIQFLSGNAGSSVRINSSGNVGIGTASPSQKLDVAGTIRFTGDLYASSVSSNIYNAILDASYEEAAAYNHETLNAYAGAHVWADSITIANAYSSDRTTPANSVSSYPFLVGGKTWQPYFNATEDEITIEIDHTPYPVRYRSAVGVQFTHSSWRANRVKIEAYNGSAWYTLVDTTTNTKAIVSTPAQLGSAGIQKIRFTFGDPQSGNGYIRVSKIFGYDYKGVSSSDQLASGTYYLDKWANNTYYGTNIPGYDSTYNLGSSTNRFLYVYSRYLDSGANTLELRSGATMLFKTGGVEKMRMDTDGNLGIGTTSPSQKLEVIGPDASSATIKWQNANRIAGYLYSDGGGAGMYVNSLANTGIYFFDSSRIDFRVGGSERVRITSAGNVGIGTSSPAQSLEVNGTILLQNNNELRWKDTGAVQRTIIRVNSSNELEYGWSGAGPVKFMGGGSYTERMRVHTNGNVGIGTTSPSMALDVVGGVKSSVGFQAPVDESSDADNVFLNGFKYGFIYNTASNKPVSGNSHYANLGNIVLTHFDSSSADDFYIRAKSYNGNTSWGKIWTDQNFTPADYIPVTDYGDFVNVTGDTMTGNLSIKATSATLTLSKTDDDQYLKFVGGTGGANQLIQTSYNLGIDTGGAGNRTMTLLSSGNVGIGTTAPKTIFDIRPAGITGLTMPTFGTAAYGGIHIVPSGLATTEAWYGITFGNTASTSSERERSTAGIYTSASGSYGNKLYFATSSSWATGAVSRMMIDHTGQVGIGTTSPSAKLHIVGANSNSEAIYLLGDDNYGAAIHYDRGGSYAWRAGVGGGSSTSSIPSSYWGIEDVSVGTTRLSIAHTSGYVGVGITLPTARLYTKSSGNESALIVDGSTIASATANKVFDVLKTSGPSAFSVRSNGLVYVGLGQLYVESNSITGRYYDSRINFGTADLTANTTNANLEFYGGFKVYKNVSNVNTEIFRVTNGGNTGINTTAPAEKLHVVGNVRIEGSSTSATLETTDKAAVPTGAIIASYAVASTYGALIDYVIYDTNRDNMRVGTMRAVWNNGDAVYNDVSTVDIGNTDPVILSAVINGTNVDLVVTGDIAFTIKASIKVIR